MGEDSDEAEPENGPAGNTSALTADLSVGTRAARDFSAARPTPHSSAPGHAMRRHEAGRFFDMVFWRRHATSTTGSGARELLLRRKPAGTGRRRTVLGAKKSWCTRTRRFKHVRWENEGPRVSTRPQVPTRRRLTCEPHSAKAQIPTASVSNDRPKRRMMRYERCPRVWNLSHRSQEMTNGHRHLWSDADLRR